MPFAAARSVTLHNNQISTMLLRLCVLRVRVNQLLNATDAQQVLVSTVAALLPAVSAQSGLVVVSSNVNFTSRSIYLLAKVRRMRFSGPQ